MLIFSFAPLSSEAREAFIKQFSSLEAPTGGLLAQLHAIESTLNCSLTATETKEGGNSSQAACRTLARAAATVRGSQRQLRQATLDLDSMVGRSNYVTVTTCWR